MAKRILGTGVYNLDTIVVRDYPEGPGKQRVFNETTVTEEVGGTRCCDAFTSRTLTESTALLSLISVSFGCDTVI